MIFEIFVIVAMFLNEFEIIFKIIFKITFKIIIKTTFKTIFDIIFKIVKKQFIDFIRKCHLMQFRYDFIKNEIATFQDLQNVF